MTDTGTAHDADAAWDAYEAAWDDVVASGGDPVEWDRQMTTGTAHDVDAAYAAAWNAVVASGGDPGEWDPTAGEDPANLWWAGEPEDLEER